MKRLIVVALTLFVSHTPALAAGPLLESALRAAKGLALTQTTQAESPKVAEARRKTADLGVGTHVAVKLTSGETVRGNIQAINDDHLVLLLDRVARPTEIAYDNVRGIGHNPGPGQTWAIIGGVVATAVILSAVAICNNERDGAGWC